MDENITLVDVADIMMGQSPSSDSYNRDGDGLPFFQGNADFGEVNPNVRVYCNKPIKVVDKNTILISVRAPIGALNISNQISCIGRGLAAVKSKGEYDNKYLYYLLLSKSKLLQNSGTGSTFKSISKKNLEEIQVRKLSIDEQIQIASKIEIVKKMISLRKEELHKLDELIKARFVEMFGDPVSNPRKWDVKNFEDISLLITDGEHATPRRAEKGIYLLSARNVLNHAIQVTDVDFIDETEYLRISNRVVPKEGDVLISCSGSIGRCCVVPPDFKFQMVRSVALIRFDDSINPVFAEWLITSDNLQRQIMQNATQSSQANLFQGKIRKLHGYVPPKKLQDEFVCFAAQVDKSKLSVQKSLDELQVLYDSLMQEYFG